LKNLRQNELKKTSLKKWFKDQPNRIVQIYRNFKPDFAKRAPIYIQLWGIGIALYEDGTYHIEDTTGG